MKINEKIKIKNINDYIDKELNKLAEIISYITLANISELQLLVLFTDYNKLIKGSSEIHNNQEAIISNAKLLSQRIFDNYYKIKYISKS